MIGEGLVAKVADFGLSRDISEDGEYIKCTEVRECHVMFVCSQYLWGSGTGNRRTLVGSRYLIPLPSITLCDILMIPLVKS